MARQVRLLASAFFARFFESELMPPGVAPARLLIGSLTLLAGPGLLLPARYGGKYIRLEPYPDKLAHALLADRLVFITLAMVASGVVALVIWDGVFPDRRDARILGVLPIGQRAVVLARLCALAALAGILLVGVNALPTLLYGPMTAAYGASSSMWRGAAAHAGATMAAGACVFCSLVALQGLLLNLLGRRAAERLAVVLQLAFVMVLLQMVFFLPRLGAALGTGLAAAASDPFLRFVPSLWFLGLYDVLGGSPEPGAAPLAASAAAATATAVAAAVALLAGSHRRLTRLALESRDAGFRRRASQAAAAWLTRLAARHGVERATFDFTLRVLTRSRQHRLLFAVYAGAGLALVASTIVPLVLRLGMAAVERPSVPILSAPLVIQFFALAGLRVVFAIPVEPAANWVFRLLEPGDRVAAVRGVWRAMVVWGVAPAVALAGAGAGLLWSGGLAVVHAIAVALLGLLLVEILLFGMDKMPFTCRYFPGTRGRTLWALYFVAFIVYCYSSVAAELRALGNAPALAAYAAAVALPTAALAAWRRRTLRSLGGLTFVEEDPDAMFEGFRLSEGLAAAAVPPPGRSGRTR